MKTLEEIKEEVAKEFNFIKYDNIRFGTFDYQKYINNEISKRYALEVAKEALKNASASLIKYYFIDNSDKAIDLKEIEKIINCENNIPEI